MKLRISQLAVMTAIFAIAALMPGKASAEHFNIDLKVVSDGTVAEAHSDETPPVGGLNPRPVLTAGIGKEITVRWTMQSAFPHGELSNVGVHFFVVREETIGQKAVPSLKEDGVVLDMEVTANFAPRGMSSGKARFSLSEPGSYLVRLQSENTAKEFGHEHFAAVDVVVK